MPRMTPKIVPGFDVQERVAKKCQNKYVHLCLTTSPSTFHHHLPTVEERSAYRELFPSEFYDAHYFNLDHDGYRPHDVFKRSDMVEYVTLHHPHHPFDPPDLRGAQGNQDAHQLEIARAQWWIRNRLPLTRAERAWIKERLPELVESGRWCPEEIVE